MRFLARIFILCFSLFTAYVANGQTANFTADFTAGCAPLVVHFTNTSTGATSYYWDLGNGITTTSTNPSTSYLSPGTYTVSLTAYNGSASNTHTITITVYPLPTVNFVASPTTVCPGTPVSFTSTSSGGVPGPMTYYWNFGDGSTGSGATPTHVYATSGNYNVTLSVTNAQGCVSSLTRTAYIHVLVPPVVNFTATGATSFCNAPATVSFTNTATGTPPLSFQWNFGDGGTSTSGSPTHTYTAPGSYSVKLIVTDGNGCKDSLTRAAYINISTLTANFTGPTTACRFTQVNFTNTSSTHTASFWDFGDGGTQTVEHGYHTWSTAGTYTVRLIVYDGYCYDTVYHTITILPSPAASFTINPAHSCPAPASITFVGSVPGGASVTWSYGDGGTGAGSTSTHTYASNGVDTIKMITTDVNGCKDTVTKLDTLYDLITKIVDSPWSGCVPLTVPFSIDIKTLQPSPPAHAYPYGMSSYSWDFGDGSPLSGLAAPSHTYTAVGVYTVIFHGITGNGCPFTDTSTIYVGTPPTVTFTATPTHACAYEHIIFTATGTPPITDYEWDFGDGSTEIDSTATASHEYHVPGVFTVTVTAYYNGCPSVPFVRTNYITIDSPKSIFDAAYSCTPPTRVVFTNHSIGADTYLWIFGDGSPNSTTVSPVHDYPALSTYTVLLITYNATSGCHDTAEQVINLIRPIPDFVADDTAVCLHDAIKFTPSVSGGSASYYAWYVNGTLIEDTSAIFVDTFHVTGRYTIRLIIRDNHGCLDTVTKTNYVVVAKPVDTFTIAPPTGCVPMSVSFTDHSTDAPGVSLTSFAWTFGDGGTGTTGSPAITHVYTAAGTYSVQEIVTDNVGCKDTLVRPASVHVNKAQASFYANTTHPCPWDVVTFTNISPGLGSSVWNFGDGGTSTSFSPTHVYTATGTYTVQLAVTDTNGCHDTARYVNYISIIAPHAAFTESDSFSVCPPLLVNFTNASTGATGYNWYFGDGNISVLTSPSDMYTSVGNYTVMLVATNFYGCKDTAIRHVTIFGYGGAFTYAPLTGCAPLTVSFSATVSNVSSIIWDFADGTTSPPTTIPTTTHTYTLPGAYLPKLILSDNTGCQNSAPGLDTIKVDAVRAGFSTSPACIGVPVTFSDTSYSYWSTVTDWFWTFDGVTSTSSTPSHIFNTAGTYTVTLQATDGWGCSANVVRDVVIYPLPNIDAGPDTTVCTGDPATLMASGGVSYVWAPPATLSCTACNPTNATPDIPTVYTVTGTDIHGCVNTDTVGVYLKTKTETTVGGGGEVCSGTPVQLFDSGATQYIWIPGYWLSDPTIADPIATPEATITYTVIAQMGSCIPDTNYVTVIVHPLPTVDAGPNQTLLAGTPAQLHATGNNIYTYSWSPSATLDCDSCQSPVASMSVTTTYYVTVSTDFGCLASDSVTISLYCDESQIFIPNTFTPNGDGQNDVFYPRGKGVSNIKSFRIYNRWGQLLFERTNIAINDESNAWDGTYNGEKPKPDVYVYYLEGVCETGAPLFIKGDVTIIR